jgi:hypothetical protein
MSFFIDLIVDFFTDVVWDGLVRLFRGVRVARPDSRDKSRLLRRNGRRGR